MFSERLQLLLSPAQRRRLEYESRTTGRSVGALVREAIDTVYDVRPPADRAAALVRIRSMHAIVPEPDELRALIDAGHDDEILGA